MNQPTASTAPAPFQESGAITGSPICRCRSRADDRLRKPADRLQGTLSRLIYGLRPGAGCRCTYTTGGRTQYNSFHCGCWLPVWRGTGPTVRLGPANCTAHSISKIKLDARLQYGEVQGGEGYTRCRACCAFSSNALLQTKSSCTKDRTWGTWPDERDMEGELSVSVQGRA